MKAKLKVRATVDFNKMPLLLATIRTEHELVLSADTLAIVTAAITKLSDDKELVAQDKALFAWELAKLLDLFSEYQEKPHSAVARLQSDWQQITGYLSLDTLKTLDASTKAIKSVRLEGTAETGLRLIVQSGVDTLSVPADRSHLSAIKAEIDLAKVLPAVVASASIKKWVDAVVIVVDVGLAIWDRWDKEQEKRQQKEEDERRKEEQARRDLERDGGEPTTTNDGGPAHDDLIDRISRTA